LEVNAMYSSIRNCVGLSLAVVVSLPGMAKLLVAEEVDRGAKINIRVYNLAKISPAYLIEAEAQTTNIFEKAGVKVVWRSVPSSDEELSQASSRQLGPSDFALRIVAQPTAGYKDPDHKALGFSLPCYQDEAGCIAYVFYHRTDQLAGECRAKGRCLSSSQILGHAAAHEIGHLLLGSYAHSPAGLMRANWWRKDLWLPSHDGLFFTSDQAELIRREVLSRMRQGGGICLRATKRKGLGRL
jgi:hypothetical protein